MAKPVSADRLKALLNKVNSLNLGGGGWWRPPVGISTIRILPPVGTMDFFFVEVGQHYLDDKSRPHYCPNICSEGKDACPICEVNEELYKAGEKDAASKFRAGRAFFMNVIDRSNPGQGVQKYAPGTTVFQAIASMISDPDYGDVSDAVEGYDIKIERQGEGKETKYQARPVKRSTPLGPDDVLMEEWLNAAEDLKAYVMGQLMPYDELAKASGVDVYFTETDEPEPPKKAAKAAVPAKPVAKKAPEPVDDEEDEEEDDEPPARKSVSAQISDRMTDREKRAQLLKKR
jgi:hypothetical protein